MTVLTNKGFLTNIFISKNSGINLTPNHVSLKKKVFMKVRERERKRERERERNRKVNTL